MRVALIVTMLTFGACGGIPGPDPPTEPDPGPTPNPEQQCHLMVPPAHCDCYAEPPEEGWVWVCCETDENGDLIHVGDPSECPEPPPDLPQPQCSTFTDRGGTVQPLDGACDCYVGEEWVACEPPPTVGCPHGFPQGQNDNMTGGPVMDDYAATVDAAMQALTGCAIGDWTCSTGMSPDDWMHAVIEEIQKTGLCAGRHIDTTPGGSDEIAVTANCAGWWEGYKVYNYTPGQRLIWSAQGKRPAWKLNDSSVCAAGPPEPPSGECVDPDPTGLEAQFTVHCGQGNGTVCDSTYKVKGREYCDQVCSPLEPDVCFTGRAWCPMRMENDPERHVCYEKIVAPQQWWCDGEPTESMDNPAKVRCTGLARTCTADGVTCGEGHP